MPRYAKQRDGYSCGPTALINIIKWSGKPISYRASRRVWIRKCATTKTGTPPLLLQIAINNHLSSYGIAHRLSTGTRQGILEHARQGGAVLVRFHWPHLSWGHYFLIVGASRHYLHTVNLYSDGSALRRIHRKSLMRLLSKRTAVWCWFLTR